jgi:hypothetical protein
MLSQISSSCDCSLRMSTANIYKRPRGPRERSLAARAGASPGSAPTSFSWTASWNSSSSATYSKTPRSTSRVGRSPSGGSVGSAPSSDVGMIPSILASVLRRWTSFYSIVWALFVYVKPVFACHSDLGTELPADGRSVSNRSSITTGNCGDTCPV